MKQDIFTGTNGENWTVPASWSTGALPGPNDDAFLTASAVLGTNETVNSIGTNQGSALTLNNSTLTATNGTVLSPSDTSSVGSGNNGGIIVDPNSHLRIGNSFDNAKTGTIWMNGGGTSIASDGAHATLINQGNIFATAHASGQIGDGVGGANHLTFSNSGVVAVSKVGSTLTLNTGSNVIADGEHGTLEADQGGKLVIDSNVSTGKNGTIEATSGGTVVIHGSVTGGILATGQVVIDGGTVDFLAGSSASVPVNFTKNGGTLELNNTSLVNVTGSGEVDLGKGAQVSVNGGHDTFKFTGTDTVKASGNSDAFIFGPATGKSTIAGWNSTDTMQLAKSDFASWNDLLHHTKQVGSDTIISVDAADTITLKGVAATSLKQSQFHFG